MKASAETSSLFSGFSVPAAHPSPRAFRQASSNGGRWKWKFRLAMLAIGSGYHPRGRHLLSSTRMIGHALWTRGAVPKLYHDDIAYEALRTPSSGVSPESENMLYVNNGIELVEGAFSRDVLGGLPADVKTLPSRRLYDERGSALFEEITKLDEYCCRVWRWSRR